MRGSRHQNSIWIGPMSENVSLRVISVVAKFHAFIINLNNSVFFWSITAGLNGGTETSKTTKKLSGHQDIAISYIQRLETVILTYQKSSL